MRLVHDPGDGPSRPLATSVEMADGFLSRARGLTFRRSIPEGHALVFRFGRPGTRRLHMLFVPFAIDAVWLVNGEVTATDTLPAWRGVSYGRGDTVLELPAGAADDVAVGDAVRVVNEG